MKLYEIKTETVGDAIVAVITKLNAYMSELGFDDVNTWNSNQKNEIDFMCWRCHDDETAPLVAKWMLAHRSKARIFIKQLLDQHPAAKPVVKPDSLNIVDMDRPEKFGSENPLGVSLSLEGPPYEGYDETWERLGELRIV